MYKEVIVIRQDLQLPKGKLAVQVAHAAVDLIRTAEQSLVEAWHDDAAKKVVLKVPSQKELFQLKSKAKRAGLNTAVIRDAGRTVLVTGTVTCIGIGPDVEEKIDAVTGELPMV